MVTKLLKRLRTPFDLYESERDKEKNKDLLDRSSRRRVSQVFSSSFNKALLKLRDTVERDDSDRFSFFDATSKILTKENLLSLGNSLARSERDKQQEQEDAERRKRLIDARNEAIRQQNEDNALKVTPTPSPQLPTPSRPPLPPQRGEKQEKRRFEAAATRLETERLDQKVEGLSSDIRESVEKDIARRRAGGEHPTVNDLSKIILSVDPEVQDSFELFLDIALPRLPQVEILTGRERELSERDRERNLVDRRISSKAFYGDNQEDDINTPGRKSLRAIFRRAGNIVRDEGISIEEAMQQAYSDLSVQLQDWNDEDMERLFIERLQDNRAKWEDDDEARELMQRVNDTWLPALGIENFDALSARERKDAIAYIVEPPGKRGFTGNDQRALFRTLDQIDPLMIPEGERKEFLSNLKDAIHSQAGMKLLGLTIDESTLIFGALFPKFTVGMLLGEAIGRPVGKEIGGIEAEILGKDREAGEVVGEEVFGLIGSLAGGGLSQAGINRAEVLTRNLLLTRSVELGFLPTATTKTPALLSEINPFKTLYERRLEEMGGRSVATTQFRHVKAAENGFNAGLNRGKIFSDLRKGGLTRKQANEALNHAERTFKESALDILRQEALGSLEYLETTGRPLSVVKAEEEAAAKTLAARTQAGERAFGIYEKLNSIRERFVSRLAVAAREASFGESALVREARRGAARLTKVESRQLARLQSIREGEVLKGPLSSAKARELESLTKIPKGQMIQEEKNRLSTLRNEANQANKPIKLTKEQSDLLKRLEDKSVQQAVGAGQIAEAEALIEESFTAQGRQVIVDIAEGKTVSRPRLVKAARDNGVSVPKGISTEELQEKLLTTAREIGEAGGRAPTKTATNLIEASNRRIAKFEEQLISAEADMQILIESEEGIRFNKAVQKFRELIEQKRGWGDLASTFGDEATEAAAILESLPGISLESLRIGAETVMNPSPLGWALSKAGPVRGIVRAIMGHGVFLEDTGKTAQIIGAGYGRERLVAEVINSRFRAWRFGVEKLWDEAGLKGIEESLYTGKARPDFPHSIGSIIARPDLYGKLSREQRAIVDMIRQSVNENLAYTERLMGVDTELFQEVLVRQAQGMEGLADGFSMVDDLALGYWPQYLDAKSFELVTGQSLKGMPFGSVGRKSAYLGKERKYTDVFDLWDAVGAGKRPIKLMDSWEAMGRRWSASGHAIADAQYRQAILRNLPNSTKKSNKFSSVVDGFGGRYFEEDVSQALNTQNRVLSGHIPNRRLRILANWVRSFKLSGDLSGALGIQGFFFLSNVVTRPAFLINHAIPMARILVSPKYFDQWYATKLPAIMRMQARGLNIATNPVDIQRITRGSLGIKNIHTIPARMADILNDANFGRMVSFYKISTAEQYLDIMRFAKLSPEFASFAEKIPGIRRMLGSLKGVEGMSDDAIERVVMESVNNRFGGLSQALIGKNANRVFWEQLLDIAPNWLRARVSVYINAFAPVKGRVSGKVFGPERYLALNMVGREIATGAALSTGLSYMLTGELPNLTKPWEFDWLGIKTPIGTIPTIPSVSVMRFLIRESKVLFDTAYDIGSGDNVTDTMYTALNDSWTQFNRSVKGRESPLVSEVVEQATGKDFYGQDISRWDRRVKKAALGILPIFIEDTVETIERDAPLGETIAISAVAAGGGSVFPPSPWENLDKAKDAEAKRLFGGLISPSGDLVYGPVVVYDDLTIDEKIAVNNTAKVAKFQEIADEKGKELGFESIWLTEEYEDKMEMLHETGRIGDDPEDLLFLTTQKEDNEKILSGDMEPSAFRKNTWDREEAEHTVSVTLRSTQDRPKFDEKEADNPVDEAVDAFYDVVPESYLDEETGRPDWGEYWPDKNAAFDEAVKQGELHSGKAGGKRVAKLLRPIPEEKAEREFKESSEVNRNIKEMPKYRFLDVEQSKLVDQYTDYATALMRMAREAGMSTSVKEVLEFFITSGVLDKKISLVAWFRQIPELRSQVWNPNRDEAVFATPYAVRYYPSLYENMSEVNKYRFRLLHEDKFFSKKWLKEEEEELSKPDIFRGLDINV